MNWLLPRFAAGILAGLITSRLFPKPSIEGLLFVIVLSYLSSCLILKVQK